MIKVTIYNEFCHEQVEEHVKKIYPEGLHKVIGKALECDDIQVRYATLYDENMNLVPDCGLTEEVLSDTDVIMWWGHMRHDFVPDDVVERVVEHIRLGMGAIFLHSGHHSKPFKKLMGTTCNLKWREGARERLWVINPAHPIMAGLNKEYFDIPEEEMYGERFDIPQPEDILMIGTYTSHEVFRSACTWTRGYGKIFYLQPGHEANPTYYIPEIQLILKNAVRWANPTFRAKEMPCPQFFELPL